MATYRIELPDGAVYEVEAPDTATEADIMAQIQQVHKQPSATPVAPVKDEGNLVGDIIGNAEAGVKAVGDLATGNWMAGSHERSQGLADKLLEGFSDDPNVLNVLKYAFNNRDKAAPGEISGALLEQMGNNPAGKAVTAIGGIMPHYNVLSAAVSRYGVKPVAEATGIPEENINLALMTAVPGAKLASKAPIIRNMPKVSAALAKPYDKAASTPDPLIQGVAKASKNVAKTYSNVRIGDKARSNEGIDTSRANYDSDASASFRGAERGGTEISQQRTRKILSGIKKALMDDGGLDPEAHSGTQRLLAKLEEHAASPETKLTSINAVRELLNGITDGTDSHKAGVFRDALYNELGKIKRNDIIRGDPNAVNLLAEGVAKWTNARRFEDVGNVIKAKGENPDQLRKGFKNFVDKKENQKTFRPEEIEAMRTISDKGNSSSTGKLIGRLGISADHPWMPAFGSAAAAGAGSLLFGPAAGVGGVAALNVLSAVTRNIRRLGARGEAETLLNMIENRDIKKPYTADLSPETPAPLALPAPSSANSFSNKVANMENANRLAATEPNIFVDWDGNARQGIPQTKPVFDANRIDYANTGMPEVANAQFNAVLNKELPLRSGSEVGAAAINRDNFYRPMGAWLKPADPPSPPAGTLSEIFYREFQRAKDADMANAPINAVEAPIAEAITPQPTVKPFSAEVVARNAAAKAGGQSELGAVGQALLDALSAPKKKPLKITVSKDPNIGADGLPRANLP